jgi:bifunctional DNA-binding transcriptional regulator/antitoxin component of YhaV-PrlF toxin-antitoxin module
MSKPMTITITDNAELALSLPPTLRRKAGIKTGDELEVRVSGGIVTFIPKLPTADDEYTPEQRRVIGARLAKADEDIKAGRVHGPFNTADEMIASMKAELKKRTAAKKPKRPR